MYQFYYAQKEKLNNEPIFKKKMSDYFNVTAIRPTMWEEHCLECSAPLCFEDCLNYAPRIDGRCKRFEDGIFITENANGVANQCATLKFRKWANMMTIIYPDMLDVEQYSKMVANHRKNSKVLKNIAYSKLPLSLRWNSIRVIEYAKRYKLKKLDGDNNPDAFVFHGFSHFEKTFNLIVEVYDHDTPKFKTALLIEPGENLHIIDKEKLDEPCWTANYVVKVYPEDNIEAEMDILWCDFVKGTKVVQDKPAEKVKCLVWDLDNTLWDGILIETDDELKLQPNKNVVDTIKALDERGIIQSIASKNDFEPAFDVVKKLGLDDYFLYPQIHWNAKSISMEQIATSLNIGIDSLALIDDSVFEREQVSSTLPMVRVYDAVELDRLLDKPEFNAIVTEESKMRRSMYRAEEKRNQIKSNSNGNADDFLRQCNIVLEVFEPTEKDEKLRCFELLLRTNQLNMSGVKYTQDEFDNIINRKDYNNIALACHDDFGSYGIVGFIQYRTNDDVLEFSEFAMSCRVAGKYVESALFEYMLNKNNCTVGHFNVNKTKKNSLLRRTLEGIGFKTIKESDDKISYEFDTELKNKDIVTVEER